LFRPDDLALAALPIAIKEKLAVQVQALLEHDYQILHNSFTFKQSIESILGQLRSNEFSDEVWARYLSTTARWDKLTDTSPWVNNKKLWDLLSAMEQEKYHQERARLS
jgi:hypothetical protein